MEKHNSSGTRLFSEEHTGWTRGNRQVAIQELTISSKKWPFFFFGGGGGGGKWGSYEGGQMVEQMLRGVGEYPSLETVKTSLDTALSTLFQLNLL